MFIDGNTHCYGCMFQRMGSGVDKEGNEFPEQTGCCAGRLEQYKQNGIEILECYNEEQNYYAIKNKICSMYRTKGWGAKQATASLQDWVKLAEEEIVGRMVDVIVFAHHNSTDEDIDKTLSILDNQKWGYPAQVHLIIRGTKEQVQPLRYIKLLSKYKFTKKFHHIEDLTMSVGDIINTVGDKCTSYYYAVFTLYHSLLRDDFIERLFDRTYRQLKGFCIAGNGISDGSVVQSKAHRVVQGNGKEKSVYDKLTELAQEQDNQKLVIRDEELYYAE